MLIVLWGLMWCIDTAFHSPGIVIIDQYSFVNHHKVLDPTVRCNGQVNILGLGCGFKQQQEEGQGRGPATKADQIKAHAAESGASGHQAGPMCLLSKNCHWAIVCIDYQYAIDMMH